MRWIVGVIAALVPAGTMAAAAQLPISASAQFLVFLHDGRVLHSHGECATLPDELVCLVKLGGGDVAESHDLLTVPLALVDTDRTSEYARALRAAHYGATRGAREYADLTADMARALSELEASTDRDRRLGIAQVARRRLTSWSADHFGYRAAETRQLVSMFDEVIAELRIAAGDTTFSLDLVANMAPVDPVALAPDPDPSQSIEAALWAAGVSPIAAERLSILRSAHRVAAALPAAPADVKARVANALNREEALDRQYRAIIERASARAGDAVRRGRPAVVRAVMRDVEASRARLGGSHDREMAAFVRRLEIEHDAALEQQAAFERWSQVRARLFAYEVRVRPVFDAWVAERQVLGLLGDGGTARPGPLDAAARRFGRLDAVLASLQPLPELDAVHALLQSAVRMARSGVELGQRLAVAPNADIARNASAAVAGAELLLARARADLIVALNPRKVR